MPMSDKSTARFRQFMLIALQSDQPGEVTAAVAKARALLKAEGISAHDFMESLKTVVHTAPPPPPPPPKQPPPQNDEDEFLRIVVMTLLTNPVRMRQKDFDFVQNCQAWAGPFTGKQKAWLYDLVDRYHLFAK